MSKFAAAFLAAFTLSATAFAAEWGDPAAELAIADWVKGESFTLAEGKGENIYVVEFWATWCGPCRATAPHLSELQAKYEDKGVIMVGITDEDRATVEPFLEEMGESMEYRIALDNNNKTAAAYMGAYGKTGIPTAFVVDKEGRVAWVGHPMDEAMERTIDQLVEGTYDLAAEIEEQKRLEEANVKMGEIVGIARSGTPEELFAAIGEVKDSENPHWLLLINMGAMLVNEEALEDTDYELAKEVIMLAIEAADGKDGVPAGRFYHLLAVADSKLGDLESAIIHEKKALELEEDPNFAEMFTRTLAEYEAALEEDPSGV